MYILKKRLFPAVVWVYLVLVFPSIQAMERQIAVTALFAATAATIACASGASQDAVAAASFAGILAAQTMPGFRWDLFDGNNQLIPFAQAPLYLTEVVIGFSVGAGFGIAAGREIVSCYQTIEELFITQ